jgi:hypothetical protein
LMMSPAHSARPTRGGGSASNALRQERRGEVRGLAPRGEPRKTGRTPDVVT